MTKHTPGPWTWKRVGEDGYVPVMALEGPSVLCRYWDTIAGKPIAVNQRALADASLIAAAPDMLEALKNLENDDGKTMPASAWALVQDAIRKAEEKKETE